MPDGNDVPSRLCGVATTGDGYRIRPYEPSDREGFLALYQAVFGKSRSDRWLRWRYGGPYTDRPRMVVVEADGELVGAEPFISFRMTGGAETVPALQPADAMVRADHRGHGLLSRMTERALETVVDSDGFFFNFPNESALATYLRLGWREVGTTATAFRVHAPSAMADELALSGATDRLAREAYGALDATARASDAVEPRRADDVSLSVHDEPPAEVLESLYRRRPPDRVHVPRTAEFYRWRLANPNWDVTTYVARVGSTPIAALVVCVESTAGATYAKILDALPAVSPDPDAMERLGAAVVADHRSADAVLVAEDTLPPSVRRRLGFLRDDALPLSLVTSPTHFVARPFSLGGRAWSLGGRRLADRGDWELSLVGQDTSV